MAKGPIENSEPVDVLAAEEFAVPAPDPALHHEHLDLPPDLIGEEPRDVLAAEEFAMPAPEEAHHPRSARKQRKQLAIKVALNAVPLAAVWLLRRARRKRGAAD
jgi:hypothetical protein